VLGGTKCTKLHLHLKLTKPQKVSQAEFLPTLAICSGLEPPRHDAKALGFVRPDHFVGDVDGIYTHPFAPQRSSSSHSLRLTTEALSLSKLSAPKFLTPIFVIP
jgi:hypothetical protein